MQTPRKKWINEQIIATIIGLAKWYKQSCYNIYDTHGVPKATLEDRLSGHVAWLEHGSKSGPDACLNDGE